MAKRKSKKSEKSKKLKLDLDGDGDFDKDDKSIAAKVLATKITEENKEVKKEVEKIDGRVAKVDINLTYRKGSLVPESQINQWKIAGINYEVWF